MKKTLLAIAFATALGAYTVGAAEAKDNWTKYCAGCHGKEGKGDTKLGQKVGVRDYTDAKVQATLKEPEMFKAVKEGLKKDDKVLMKPYSDKLTDEEIKALVTFIKKLKK